MGGKQKLRKNVSVDFYSEQWCLFFILVWVFKLEPFSRDARILGNPILFKLVSSNCAISFPPQNHEEDFCCSECIAPQNVHRNLSGQFFVRMQDPVQLRSVPSFSRTWLPAYSTPTLYYQKPSSGRSYSTGPFQTTLIFNKDILCPHALGTRTYLLAKWDRGLFSEVALTWWRSCTHSFNKDSFNFWLKQMYATRIRLTKIWSLRNVKYYASP